MQQDRSKKACHLFYVCEVRQSCKHTVKSGEDKAGQGFYEAEQVTAVTALVMTNIYVMVNV
jgi:hypothetical protein